MGAPCCPVTYSGPKLIV